MKPAYRIPLGKFPLVARFISQETAANTPITEMVVNSLITSHADGASRSKAGATVGGIAWDGGYGIARSKSRPTAARPGSRRRSGEDLGRFAFRTLSFPLTRRRARSTVMARASNVIGQTQTTELIHNPAGYHHNVIHSVTLNVG